VPVFLDSNGVIGADFVNDVGAFGQLDLQLALPLAYSDGPADFVVTTGLQQVDEPNIVRCGFGFVRLFLGSACFLLSFTNSGDVLAAVVRLAKLEDLQNQICLFPEFPPENVVRWKSRRAFRLEPQIAAHWKPPQLSSQVNEGQKHYFEVEALLQLIRNDPGLLDRVSPTRPVFSELIGIFGIFDTGLAKEAFSAKGLIRIGGGSSFDLGKYVRLGHDRPFVNATAGSRGPPYWFRDPASG